MNQQLPTSELTPGVDAYFSIDGGATNLGNVATGEFFGDGWQPGHWQVGNAQGLMDVNLPDGVIHNLSGLDLRAMDVIGWDVANVREPNSLLGILVILPSFSLYVFSLR